jgi:hypothetical protein
MGGGRSCVGAALRTEARRSGGGGGTFEPSGLGTPGPTSSRGVLDSPPVPAFPPVRAGLAAPFAGEFPLAALAVDLSTFSKMALNPSLTFFPATPPTEPPAAAAAVSTIDCPWAEPQIAIPQSNTAAHGAAPRSRQVAADGVAPRIPRIIQYPLTNRTSEMPVIIRAVSPISLTKITQHHYHVGLC